MSSNSITWAMAEKGYQNGTLEQSQPYVKDALDNASFSANKITLLACSLFMALGIAGITYVFYNQTYGDPSFEDLSLVTVFSMFVFSGGFVTLAAIVNNILNNQDIIHKDKDTKGQPHLQKLITQTKNHHEMLLKLKGGQ